MNIESISKYKDNSKILIFLRNKRHFTGRILSIENNSIVFCDKFGEELTFEADFVLCIEPVKEK